MLDFEAIIQNFFIVFAVSLWEVLNSVANIVLFIFFLTEGCLVQIRLP